MSTPLRRELTVISATALIVANMIGTGVFTTTGFLAADLGRSSLVLGEWVVGGILALAGCLVYAELGVNLPRSGGEYVYLREAWGPGWGFLSGWVSFFAGFSAPTAAAALAFAAYLSYFLPSLSPTVEANARHPWLHLSGGRLLASAVVIASGLVNIGSVRVAARLQNLLTALKLAVLVGFLALAFFVGKGDWNHFSAGTARTSSSSLALQFAVSLTFVMFAYSGWNAATYVAEEIRRPERTLPQALIGGTALVTVIYLAINLAFVYALPLEALKGVLPVGAKSANALFPGRGGVVFGATMAAGLLSCVNAMMLVGPRVYYAMAQDGCFLVSASRVHPRWQTPFVAIIFQTVASVVMIITGTFEALIYYIGFMLVFFAALATAGLFRLRKRNDWRRLTAVDCCYPLVPASFLIASSGMLISTIRLRPRETLFGVATVACGGIIYRWKLHRLAGNRRETCG